MRFRFRGAIQKPRLLPQIHRLGFIERRHFLDGYTRMRQFIDRRAQILSTVSDIRSQRQVNCFFNHALSFGGVYFTMSAPASAHLSPTPNSRAILFAPAMRLLPSPPSPNSLAPDSLLSPSPVSCSCLQLLSVDCQLLFLCARIPPCARSSSASVSASTATSPAPMARSIFSSCPRTIPWAHSSLPSTRRLWDARPTITLSKWAGATSAAQR